ncbi:MAG: vanadium-dependent haloperoxidase [Candidatus Methylumidiphilus sp.]
MRLLTFSTPQSAIAAAVLAALSSAGASADAVTDWNTITVEATKNAGAFYLGGQVRPAVLNSNLASYLDALQSRAAYDAVNTVDNFSPTRFYYNGSYAGPVNATAAQAAAVQASYDVVTNQLSPYFANTAAWGQTQTWLQSKLADSLTALGGGSDANVAAGVAVGHAAASAALAARAGDVPNLAPSSLTTYPGPATPGVGEWRPTPSAGVIDATYGAPTGFNADGTPALRNGIDSNWGSLTPFGISNAEKNAVVAAVPAHPAVGSAEYNAELSFVQSVGEYGSATRSQDQTAQALFYRQDAEVVVNDAARQLAIANGNTLDQNAQLFAAVNTATADARIATWGEKYGALFWRPVTAINALADGSVASYDWKPLFATPPHPSYTAGHSATVTAGLEVVKAFFGDSQNLTLGSLSWLQGSGSGTGSWAAQDVTTRQITSLTQAEVENGLSRLYGGIHWGADNLYGQNVGVEVADLVLAQFGLSVAAGDTLRVYLSEAAAGTGNLDKFGVFGLSGAAPVPVPAAFPLFGSALAGLLVLGRRRLKA